MTIIRMYACLESHWRGSRNRTKYRTGDRRKPAKGKCLPVSIDKHNKMRPDYSICLSITLKLRAVNPILKTVPKTEAIGIMFDSNSGICRHNCHLRRKLSADIYLSWRTPESNIEGTRVWKYAVPTVIFDNAHVYLDDYGDVRLMVGILFVCQHDIRSDGNQKKCMVSIPTGRSFRSMFHSFEIRSSIERAHKAVWATLPNWRFCSDDHVDRNF